MKAKVAARVAAMGLCLSWVLGAQAQNFTLDWWTIDGGGGTSSGGACTITGTLGQPDAGPLMIGGNFALVGGFWALPGLVQIPGAPTLYITNAAPGWATIWWIPPTPGFTLQASPAVAPAAWTNAPSGTNNPALAPATLQALFYRLHKP